MEPDKALVRLNRALVLRPQFAEALFVRGFCHRQRCQDAAAAEDLLEYLRQQGAQLPVNETNGKVKRAEHLEKGVTNEQNEKALLEVFSISLDAFLKTLELPPVEIPIVGTSHGVNWLGRIILRLIQQRRWDDALRCLEHPKVKASGNHAFYRAIAHWGKRGEPCRDLCSQALRAYMPWLGESFNEESGDFQNPPEDVSSLFDITLLCWGAGDISAAEVALKQTLACLDFIEQVGASLLFDTSSWSFQETTRHQFRRDCEDLARMIRGEPVRPAFLAPLTAP